MSRQTVLAAFDQLRAEGYLESRERAGTFVSSAVPDELLATGRRTRSHSRAIDAAKHDGRGPRGASERVSTRDTGAIRRDAPGGEKGPPDGMYGRSLPARPFRSGLPALDVFPWKTWARLLGRRLRDGATSLGDYGDARGDARLRGAIAAHVGLSRGVRCSADQVIVTTGAQQALALVRSVLLSPGDEIWMEEPGYGRARLALGQNGTSLVPVPVDAAGMCVDVGIAMAPRARAAYVTPSHQLPLGVTMSLARRFELLDWAGTTRSWIIEDDYDSEYRYTTRPITALQGLDTASCVLYVGSFSKTMFPSLRLGYIVVPESLVTAFASARFASDRSGASIEQAALADFIDDGHFPAHLRKMRRLYESRRNALVAAVAGLAPELGLGPADGGMHVVATLPIGISDRAVAAAGTSHGLELAPLSAYAVTPRTQGGLVLGFSAFDETALRDAVETLARVVRKVMRES